MGIRREGFSGSGITTEIMRGPDSLLDSVVSGSASGDGRGATSGVSSDSIILAGAFDLLSWLSTRSATPVSSPSGGSAPFEGSFGVSSFCNIGILAGDDNSARVMLETMRACSTVGVGTCSGLIGFLCAIFFNEEREFAQALFFVPVDLDFAAIELHKIACQSQFKRRILTAPIRAKVFQHLVQVGRHGLVASKTNAEPASANRRHQQSDALLCPA